MHARHITLLLRDALDAPALVWTTGGTATWSGQDVTTHDNEDAAQSGQSTACPTRKRFRTCRDQKNVFVPESIGNKS